MTMAAFVYGFHHNWVNIFLITFLQLFCFPLEFISNSLFMFIQIQYQMYKSDMAG